jgi:flagellar protein FlaJ
LFDRDGTFVSELDRRLEEADVRAEPEVYVQRWLSVGAIVGTTFGILGGVVGGLLVRADAVSLGVFSTESPAAFLTGVTASAIAFGMLGAVASVSYAVYRLRVIAARRRRRIDRHLPDAVSFMYALSHGGLSYLDVFREVAAAEDTYSEVATEFGRVVRRMQFGVDNRDAVRQVAATTPSGELARFLRSLVGVLDTGGSFDSWVETQERKFEKRARAAQQEELDVIDVLNEVYIVSSTLPVFLVVVLAVAMFMGYSVASAVGVSVYIFEPFVGVMVILLVNTVTRDAMTTGTVDPHEDVDVAAGRESGVLDADVFDHYRGVADDDRTRRVFERLRRREVNRRIATALSAPLSFLGSAPRYTLFATLPTVVVVVTGLVWTGVAQTTAFTTPIGSLPVPSVEALYAAPATWTLVWVYVPTTLLAGPAAWVYERRARKRSRLVDGLTDALSDLAENNEAGQPLLQAFGTTGRDGRGPLADEFWRIYRQVGQGSRLEDELIAFINRVRHPRIARSITPIVRAQRASNDIADVLRTVAVISDMHDDVQRRRDRITKQHSVVGFVTFASLSGVLLVLQVNFVSRVADLAATKGTATPAGSGVTAFAAIDAGQLSAFFFHAIVIQAVLSGLVTGYMRTERFFAGVKYSLAFMFVGYGAWTLGTAVF